MQIASVLAIGFCSFILFIVCGIPILLRVITGKWPYMTIKGCPCCPYNMSQWICCKICTVLADHQSEKSESEENKNQGQVHPAFRSMV